MTCASDGGAPVSDNNAPVLVRNPGFLSENRPTSSAILLERPGVSDISDKSDNNLQTFSTDNDAPSDIPPRPLKPTVSVSGTLEERGKARRRPANCCQKRQLCQKPGDPIPRPPARGLSCQGRMVEPLERLSHLSGRGLVPNGI